jgi:hypothetical protein
MPNWHSSICVEVSVLLIGVETFHVASDLQKILGQQRSAERFSTPAFALEEEVNAVVQLLCLVLAHGYFLSVRLNSLGPGMFKLKPKPFCVVAPSVFSAASDLFLFDLCHPFRARYCSY